MMQDLEYRIAELERRMLGMIRIGTIKELIGDRVIVKAGDLVTAPLPWVTRRAGKDRDFWAPEPGEQVLLVCPCGDPALGVVIPAIYWDDFPAPASGSNIRRTVYSDGTTIEYDRKIHKLSGLIKGDVDLAVDNNASVKAGNKAIIEAANGADIIAPIINLAGNVSQTGNDGGQGSEIKKANTVQTGKFILNGAFIVNGPFTVNDNITATGSIIDGGGNSPNHAH
ncbi:MAG: phage baseplate assembly protein V [Desulfobacteraceae bacterium]|nr:phage baseplate assembly protein V [Desulfobacteraceae bacterium]